MPNDESKATAAPAIATKVGLLLSAAAALSSCGGDGGDVPPSGRAKPLAVAPAEQSLVIAPMMSGTFFCDEALTPPRAADEDAAARLCGALGKTAGNRIGAKLDEIGPKISPSGEYQLGYTLIVPLVRYFKKVNGAWVLDVQTLKANLATIAEVDRPVVVHLSATHFTYSGIEYSRELAQDTRNLQWTRSGPATPADYFTVPIVAWTLGDETAPVNVMRRLAMNAAIDALCELPASAQQRIVGVSVLGETHDVFPNLNGGPGYDLDPAQMTDHAPVMASGFRIWLSQKYGSIDVLNQHLRANYPSFDAIRPPTRDIRKEVLDGYFDHTDTYAAGKVPFYGWLYDPRGRNLSIKVLVDGKDAGHAELGFSRTDVTEALNLSEPNVGFRYDLDFRQLELAYGSHTVELLVSIDGGAPLLLARRDLVHIDRALSPWVKIPSAESSAQPLGTDPSLIGSLDGPAPGLTSIFYNPVADLWLQFRNLVVRNYIERFARIASKSCIPKAKVFSHQIAPNLYGSWNADVLAVDASLETNDSYNPGVTLYGGTALGGALTAMRQRLGWTRYAVNEMHPIVPLADAQYLDMFNMHRTSGAAFVSPYYMETIAFEEGDGLQRFRIDSTNTRYGSDRFYRAIKSVMTR